MEDTRIKMNKVLELLTSDLASLKVGRATPALVEKIVVEAYDTKMPLVELSTISVSGPSELLVTPFDKTILKNIEKALGMDRGLGISPSVDGEVIHLRIPPLTEEKRVEMTKVLNQRLEAARVMIRQVRAERMAEIKRAFEEKEIFEDDRKRQEEETQKITDEMTGKIESIGEAKKSELLGQ